MDPDIQDILERLKVLEELTPFPEAHTGAEDDYAEPSDVSCWSVEEETASPIKTTLSEAPLLRTSGVPVSGQEGFPSRRRYCSYSGEVWLQNNVGDILHWYYLETFAIRAARAAYPNGRGVARGYVERRNTDKARIGWRGEWFGGHCSPVGCWARFVTATGQGWIYTWHWTR